MDDILYNYLVHICGEENILLNEPLSKWTTFRVGGPAKYFVTVKDKEILGKLLSALKFLEQKYFILGMGANVLASDKGYDGVIIKLGFKEITHTDNFIYADAGAKLGVVVNYAKDNGMSGLEWATGIPATIGGAVYMNCGAYGKQMQDVVVMVDIIQDGELSTISVNDINYGYRHSVFQEQDITILGAYLRLEKGDTQTIQNAMREIIVKRSTHPKQPSAGSVFKRPKDGFYVSRTIDELGLKNYTVGGARISEKHAGFIVNDGGATCDDILNVIYKVQDEIEKATGVMLETELIFLGEI